MFSRRIPPISGILFLPFEGLYAEVVNSGLVEQLQREYSISVAGPSTMAAILNALQMGFRTLAIQKHSHEAWVVLAQSAASSKSSPERSKRRRKVSRAQSSSWNFWQGHAPVPLCASSGKWNGFSRRNCTGKVNKGSVYSKSACSVWDRRIF